MIENAEEFQTASDEFSDWLKNATKTVQSYDPVSVDPEKLKQQLDEVQVTLRTVFVISLDTSHIHGHNHGRSHSHGHGHGCGCDCGHGYGHGYILGQGHGHGHCFGHGDGHGNCYGHVHGSRPHSLLWP